VPKSLWTSADGVPVETLSLASARRRAFEVPFVAAPASAVAVAPVLSLPGKSVRATSCVSVLRRVPAEPVDGLALSDLIVTDGAPVATVSRASERSAE
jgi:hypothetical protein